MVEYLLELNDKIENALAEIAKAESVVAEKKAELKQLNKLSWYCLNCKKHYPKDKVIRSYEKVTAIETVYTDAGYGDDDEIAEVTRLATVLQCPVCGRRFIQNGGTKLGERNRHTRR